ncbi:MAG TPA: hypothetical protein PKI00_02845 [Candidatus Pacearchaeota archaeon]|nr:hypothetical protein [Candidatus Pacearchaeota archaeon]
MKKLIIISFIIAVFCFSFASAQIAIQNPLGDIDNFQELVNRLIDWMIMMALVIVPLCIVWGGFTFATAGGDTNKVERAKSILTWSIAGLIVVLLAKSLVESLRKLFE